MNICMSNLLKDSVKVLSGHYSPDTAFVVEDYPYGFKLRCKIRYWLEVNKRGTRFLSQTTNPKKAFDAAGLPIDSWNKPKASTYSEYGVMIQFPPCSDGIQRVSWVAVSGWTEEYPKFLEDYGAGLNQEQFLSLKTIVGLIERRK